MWYILKNGKITPASAAEFSEWKTQTREWVIEKTQVDDYEVSTVFLGLDHSFGHGSALLLYETMVFDKEGYDVAMNRYATMGQAKVGHWEMVESLTQKKEQSDD